MRIYLAHSTSHDYDTDLYQPIEAALGKEHTIFLPHKSDPEGKHSRDIIANSDIILAEVSYASTGQGIELGWAYDSKIPIICFSRDGAKVSSALRFICDTFVEYTDSADMIVQLKKALAEHTNS